MDINAYISYTQFWDMLNVFSVYSAATGKIKRFPPVIDSQSTQNYVHLKQTQVFCNINQLVQHRWIYPQIKILFQRRKHHLRVSALWAADGGWDGTQKRTKRAKSHFLLWFVRWSDTIQMGTTNVFLSFLPNLVILLQSRFLKLYYATEKCVDPIQQRDCSLHQPIVLYSVGERNVKWWKVSTRRVT